MKDGPRVPSTVNSTDTGAIFRTYGSFYGIGFKTYTRFKKLKNNKIRINKNLNNDQQTFILNLKP